jgi:flagellar biosynthesis protein FlhA
MAEPQAAAAGEGGGILERIAALTRHGDVLLAVGVVTILMVLILPLPRALLDLSLAISITFSVLILMVALFIQRPLDFSSFPTILLISTMLRRSTSRRRGSS